MSEETDDKPRRFYRQPQPWIVWSEQDGRWWGPGGMGYVDSILAAGRYTEAEAKEIADNANRYSLTLNEVAMPDPVRSDLRVNPTP